MEFEYGKKLKSAREEKGLSIGDVSFDLKINISTLKKIEQSDTEGLPKAPFTKGFIRTYCLYLDLTPGLVIEEYEQTLEEPSTKIKKGILSTDDEVGAFFAFDFFRTRLLPLGILLMMILGAVATYSYLKKGAFDIYPGQKIVSERARAIEVAAEEKLKNTPEKSNKEEAVKELEKPEKLTRLATVYKGDKALESREKNKMTEASLLEKMPAVVLKNLLIVEPLAETHLYIKTGQDEKYIRATLKPDVLRRFKFNEATIRFLDAGAVNLIFNGEDVGALGLFGEEKTIKFPSMKEL